MKVFFNCTTNVVGGGAKNSAIFISEVVKNTDNVWRFALSPQVKEILDSWGVELDYATVFPVSPAKSLTARRQLKRLVSDFDADVVYTMAGPSYVKFPVTHVQGISNAYISHPEYSDLRRILPVFDLLSCFLRSAYQRFMARKADYFIFQTKSALSGFCRRTDIPESRACVIPNAVDLNNFSGLHFEGRRSIDSITSILCPAADYPHKSLQFIPRYAKELVSRGFDKFVFLLTIPEEGKLFDQICKEANYLGVSGYIRTTGPYSYASAKSVYSSCDFVFVPSLLETFSATYLEAFAAKKPLLAADRGFARDVCENAAVYIDPYDSPGTADAFIRLFSSPEKCKELVANGEKVLASCETQSSRTLKICSYLTKVAQRNTPPAV